MLRVLLAVTNDVATDNRLHKIANTLIDNGYTVMVAGRLLPGSPSVANRAYQVQRFKLWFRKGPLFYLSYNLILFLFLIRKKFQIIVANDLDTLVACYLASKFRKVPLVYDSHEYFTGVPELVDRPFVRSIWKFAEKKIVPHVKYAYTVSELIANQYKDEYSIDFEVIKNASMFRYNDEFEHTVSRVNKKIILYQGVLNKGRGLEMMIEAMRYLDNYMLKIIGVGDIEKDLRKLVNYYGLAARVEFIGRIPYNELWPYTHTADLGFSLEEDMGMNYRFALPNKLFDYIQARLPVLVSDLPEMKKIIDKYDIGEIVVNREPKLIAEQVKRMMEDEKSYHNWKINLELAARELCWQREEEKLLTLYRRSLKEAVC